MTTPRPSGEPFFAAGGEHGALLLHGFNSTPATMRPLAELLAAQGYAVQLPLLPGHGGTTEDLMVTGFADWFAAADDALTRLRQHCTKVAVMGLSMGATLALRLVQTRDNVDALVLINPLVTHPGPGVAQQIEDALRAGVTTHSSISGDIKRQGVYEPERRATPLASLRSLFNELLVVREELGRVRVPVLLMSSREDHTVHPENGDDLVALVGGPVERHWLEDSFHVATLDNDQDYLEDTIVNYLAKEFAHEHPVNP